VQIIVTSYRRLKYLQQTVASLRQDPAEVYIVDGGSDAETVDWIKANADGWLLFQNNPGADYLKTEGIKRFATAREFVITSDDLLFPAGYAARIMANYQAINSKYPKIDWTFCACQMPHQGITREMWQMINGVKCFPCSKSQVAGAIIDTAIAKQIGYFPNYGRTGQGDFAFNKRLEAIGIKRCYWKNPSLIHIGGDKPTDYPELHAEYLADKAQHMAHGRADDGATLPPGPQREVIGYNENL
jgi:glycosyltransferase involved in cell wall biosynthesis